jgi:dihydroorotate dehydrogenase
MLGRLPRSRSLMVNKGFKNPGAEAIVTKLKGLSFGVPVGVSIGRTNSQHPKGQTESVEDIVECFQTFERSSVQHAYYELNISCPNLYGSVSFYPPDNLEELLVAVDALHLSRPVFVKMPIDKSDEETLGMLQVISRHTLAGVIFGNLQKDRSHPDLVPEEVARFTVGNFSGKPTYKRSNELIRLAYHRYGKQLVIIGCGGVFSAEDAYTKIRLGASLVQLITGMIFEGPQLISEINFGLERLLERDGFAHISEAVGVDV